MRKRILTEDDLKDIDLNQFEATDKNQHNFNTLRTPGVYRLWHSATSPCKTSADYIMVVYKHNANIIQVAHSSTANSKLKNRVYSRSYYNSQWQEWKELGGTESNSSSTIVIANYNSHDNSKKAADILINNGENAAKKINDAIQSLKGIGGEVKLMEGTYNLEYGIAVNIPNVHLTGIPGATILKQNANWSDNPYIVGYSNKKNIIDTRGLEDNNRASISNLILDGFNIENSSGFRCSDSSQVANCISNNSGSSGFYCAGFSRATNCTSNNSGTHGFQCWDSSQVANCISDNSGSDGFYCWDSSQVANCISNNSGSSGFYCTSGFKGICSFNILKGDKLNDKSSSPAIVEYNIIQ